MQRHTSSMVDVDRDFQAFTGLPVTGQLDQATVNKMRSPRCGFPDMPSGPRNTSTSWGDPSAPHSFYTLGEYCTKVVETPSFCLPLCVSTSHCLCPSDSFDRAGVEIQLLICLSFVTIVSGQNGTSSSIQTKCTTSLRMYTNTSDSKFSAA